MAIIGGTLAKGAIRFLDRQKENNWFLKKLASLGTWAKGQIPIIILSESLPGASTNPPC
jgi:hypothetical protein